MSQTTSHTTFEFLITTSKGLDGMLLEEIAQICPDVALKSKPGQVLFSGELADAYKVCIWSRLANRVLVKLAEGEVNGSSALVPHSQTVLDSYDMNSNPFQ